MKALFFFGLFLPAFAGRAFGSPAVPVPDSVIRTLTVDTLSILHDTALVRVTETENGRLTREVNAFSVPGRLWVTPFRGSVWLWFRIIRFDLAELIYQGRVTTYFPDGTRRCQTFDHGNKEQDLYLDREGNTIAPPPPPPARPRNQVVLLCGRVIEGRSAILLGRHHRRKRYRQASNRSSTVK